MIRARGGHMRGSRAAPMRPNVVHAPCMLRAPKMPVERAVGARAAGRPASPRRGFSSVSPASSRVARLAIASQFHLCPCRANSRQSPPSAHQPAQSICSLRMSQNTHMSSPHTHTHTASEHTSDSDTDTQSQSQSRHDDVANTHEWHTWKVRSTEYIACPGSHVTGLAQSSLRGPSWTFCGSW